MNRDRTSGSARTGIANPGRSPWRMIAGTLAIVGGCTLVAMAMRGHFELTNLTMVYLLGVVVAAVAFGRRAAIAAAILSVATFDFLLVHPRFSFAVEDAQYLVTFAVMLVVAVVIGTLTAWVREQRRAAELRERRTAALYRLSHDLLVRSTAAEVLQAAVERIGALVGAEAAILLPDPQGRLCHAAGSEALAAEPRELAAAQWAHDNGQPAGQGAAAHPEAAAHHLPLLAPLRTLGVLAVRAGARLEPERLDLLRALASQTALALERCRLAEDAQLARTQAETERTRSALLSSVSHDLRTPLAAITGAASSLRDDDGRLSEATRRELADTISDEGLRLNRLIGNLLDMTTLESGTLRVRKEWQALEEVVGAALARLEPTLGHREVRVRLPGDLPLVPLDEVLFEQLLINLIENAHKYSPPGSPIELDAEADGAWLALRVTDHGPGIANEERRRVFEKFYRGTRASGRAGAGLGLAICQGIAVAHGGTIEAGNRAGGGAVFTVRLPLEGEAPRIEDEGTEAPPERAEAPAPPAHGAASGGSAR